MKSNVNITGPRRGAGLFALWLALLGASGCMQFRAHERAAEDAPPAALPAEQPEQSGTAAEAAAGQAAQGTAERAAESAVEPAAEPPAPLQRLPLTPAEEDEVARLLYQAERAIDDDHLTYPARGSALALYDQVRILDPDNDDARRGLERIVERYLELALLGADQRRFSHARAMLDRARLVDPQHPNIAPTRWQIDLLARADRQVIPLDGKRLREHDPGLNDTLRQAGVASRAHGCRAQITARSDSEGRWIYQQMSQAPGNDRIRAELDIGSPPRIEVLCFSE